MLLSFLFPKNTEVLFIENISLPELSLKYDPRTIFSDEIVALFHYKDDMIRKLIWALKYKKNYKAARLFSDMLYPYLLETIYDLSLFTDDQKLLLLPIPISKQVLRRRGYNQMHLILEELGKHDDNLHFYYLTDVLIKKQNTKSQVVAGDKRSREKNIKYAFSVLAPHKIKGRSIILLDDVLTTGSTVGAARWVLMQAGAKRVHTVVLAH